MLRPVSEAVPCLNSRVDREFSVRPSASPSISTTISVAASLPRQRLDDSPFTRSKRISGAPVAAWRLAVSNVENAVASSERPSIDSNLPLAASPDSHTHRPPSNTIAAGAALCTRFISSIAAGPIGSCSSTIAPSLMERTLSKLLALLSARTKEPVTHNCQNDAN